MEDWFVWPGGDPRPCLTRITGVPRLGTSSGSSPVLTVKSILFRFRPDWSPLKGRLRFQSSAKNLDKFLLGRRIQKLQGSNHQDFYMTKAEQQLANPVLPVSVGRYRCGDNEPLLLIAGPCVLQTLDLASQIAQVLAELNQREDVNVVFKASFDKANRTSLTAQRGPGLEDGLRMLEQIGQRFDLPTTTDIHLPNQAEPVAQVCSLLQIPAFLARQTDLLVAAAQTGKPVNVKKGQFMAPEDMKYVVEKVRGSRDRQDGGDGGVMLCERGTFFGYGRLVNDMQSLPLMRSLGAPVVFDATHSVQRPGGLGGATGGNREMVEPLARAAVAIGTDGIFFETHPDPATSPSDGANMIALDSFQPLIDRLLLLRAVVVATT